MVLKSGGQEVRVIANENRLLKLEEKLKANELTPMKFLRGASHHVHEYNIANGQDNEFPDYSSDEAEGEDSNDNANCMVCLVGIPDTAIVPCGHVHCRSCSQRLLDSGSHCPRCRTNIVSLLQIYQ